MIKQLYLINNITQRGIIHNERVFEFIYVSWQVEFRNYSWVCEPFHRGMYSLKSYSMKCLLTNYWVTIRNYITNILKKISCPKTKITWESMFSCIIWKKNRWNKYFSYLVKYSTSNWSSAQELEKCKGTETEKFPSMKGI